MKNRSPSRVLEDAMQRADALRHGEQDANEVFRWLAESPRHVEELLFAQEILDGIAAFTPQQQAALAARRDEEGEDDLLEGKVVPLNPLGADAFSHDSSVRNEARRKLKWPAIGIAAATLVVLLGTWLVRDDAWVTYSTTLGEQRVLKLADGSTVHLNTSSTLKTRFTETTRELELAAGEALFNVRRDARRPFRVTANGSVVEAVGTKFDVYRRSHDIQVSVIEGAVQVSNSHESSPIRLTAGRSISVDAKGQIAITERPAVNAAAWSERRLIFKGDSLRDIAEEFNRYNRAPRIEVADAQAAMQRFAGTFDADAPEALMEALALNPKLEVRWVDGNIVVATRKLR